MNREIKFRGKRIDDGNWVYGDLVHTTSSKNGVQGSHSLIGIDQDFFEVIPETVGQYINIDDKKGKKIYEGDKVRFKTWGKRNGVVENVSFIDGQLLPFFDFEYIQDEQGDPFDDEYGFKVVGNIHE